MSLCVCGSGRSFDDCCGPVLDGGPAPSAEALMRSRYSAYVLGKIDYLGYSCAAKERATFDREEAEQVIQETEWLGLKVIKTEAGGETDDTGLVDFAFSFAQDGKEHTQREVARFSREDGRWVYAGSDFDPKGEPERVAKTGRNDPCPCGSGKKYKKCCGA